MEKYQGFTFDHKGGAFRCHQHPSLAVKDDRLSWYWHSRSVGGHGALDYLVKAENMGFREAVSIITGATPPTAPLRLDNPTMEKPKALVLPERTGIPLKLYDYLCIKRGIDSDIVQTLIQKGQLYEDRRGNVVFVGHDEQGKARFASVRGTYGDFRGDCAGSDKRYGFNMPASPPSERLYIFESAIDAMSHGSLENAYTGDRDAWKRDNRLSLAGTSDAALPFFLNRHTAVRELVFCLDNDQPGWDNAVAMACKYADKGYVTRLELPRGKDFNLDLQALRRQVLAEKHTQTIQKKSRAAEL